MKLFFGEVRSTFKKMKELAKVRMYIRDKKGGLSSGGQCLGLIEWHGSTKYCNGTFSSDTLELTEKRWIGSVQVSVLMESQEY